MWLAVRLHHLLPECLQWPSHLEHPHLHLLAVWLPQKLLLTHPAEQMQECSGGMDSEASALVQRQQPVLQRPPTGIR